MSSLKNIFLHHIAQTSPSPDGFEVSRGNGIYLYDQEGNAYIDGISGIAVSNTGHHHPRIVTALQQQLESYLHTQVYGEHVIAPQVLFAQKLVSFLPVSLNSVFFTNSGAEAVEGGLKLARKFTGRYEIVAAKNSYHGSTAGAESLRSDLDHTLHFRPLVPGVKHIRYNHAEDLESITHKTAAIIIEPVQGEAGVIIPAKEYLQAVRQRCNETGTLFILDEIQTGMGRTGTLWAMEQTGIVPDILLLAKALGGGLPLGAFIADKNIMQSLADHPPLGHLTTNGGNALCCTAGQTALEIITDDNLSGRAKDQGVIFKSAIENHPNVREVRAAGLMMAVELYEPGSLMEVIQRCRKSGLLVDFFLFNDRSIRVYPPLITTGEEMNLIIEKMMSSL